MVQILHTLGLSSKGCPRGSKGTQVAQGVWTSDSEVSYLIVSWIVLSVYRNIETTWNQKVPH